MSLVEKPKDRSSTAGQKFWPLKKFNLHNHHGKNIEQQVAMEGAPLKPVQTAELETGTADGTNSAALYAHVYVLLTYIYNRSQTDLEY